MNLEDLRLSYTRFGLSENDLHPDPFQQFRLWFDQALEANLPEPNAMTLATVAPDGTPHARTVLLKGLNPGFVFYTNYQSQKAQDLAHNNRAAILFFWPELERQVRVTGTVSKVSPEESDAYFKTRPAGHRLGAWASPQSTIVASRAVLEESAEIAKQKFGEQDVPRPDWWGGYRLQPSRIEFWQGRVNRLHDRIEYVQNGGTWNFHRLAP
jgi:pyridoxamine 5'-phosphate oxidase